MWSHTFSGALCVVEVPGIRLNHRAFDWIIAARQMEGFGRFDSLWKAEILTFRMAVVSIPEMIPTTFYGRIEMVTIWIQSER